MNTKQKPPKRVRFLTGVGYLFALLTWAWGVLFYVPFILELPLLQSKEIAQDTPIVHSMPPPSVAVPESFAILISAIVVVIVVGVTLYALWRIPAAIVKTGDTVTQASTRLVLPVISHHKKLSPAKRRTLSERTMVWVRLVVALLPLVLIVPLAGMSYPSAYGTEISFRLIVTVVAFHAVIALVCFVAVPLVTKMRHRQNDA